MTNYICLLRDRIINETRFENSKLDGLAENNAQLLRRILKLEDSLNYLKNIQPSETTQYELTDKFIGSTFNDQYSSIHYNPISEQKLFSSQQGLYNNLQTINFDKRLQAMEMKLRNLFTEGNTSNILSKYAIKIVTETYHPIECTNQHCTDFCQNAEYTPSKMNECLHLNLNGLQSCSRCLNPSARSQCTIQTPNAFNKNSQFDKSVQTTDYDRKNVIMNSICSRNKTLTGEHQMVANSVTSDCMGMMKNSLIVPTSPDNSCVIKTNLLNNNNDDAESISKFTSSECLDIVESPDSQISVLKQDCYNHLKTEQNKSQRNSIHQLKQSHNFESGLNNEGNYHDIDKTPATSRSYKRSKLFYPNCHYASMGRCLDNSHKQSVLESSFETIYDQTKIW
ncbi:unnamed protein product [Heterobilharzia americana]|nr:unnamed protein product [Heterobilharzia americana]